MLLQPLKNVLQKKLTEYEIKQTLENNVLILHGFMEVDDTYDTEAWIRFTFDDENNVVTIEIKDIDNRDMFKQFRATEFDMFEKIVDMTLRTTRIF